MTPDEAAEMIKDDMRLHHDYLSGTYRKALKMAVNALKTEAIPIEWLEQHYPPAVMTDLTEYIIKVRVIDDVIRAWRAERKEE